MTDSDFYFDPAQEMTPEELNIAKQQSPGGQLPPGYYKAIIDKSKGIKYTDKKLNVEVDALTIDFKVIEGDYADFKVSEFITPRHPTEGKAKASRIQYARICEALFGKPQAFRPEEIIDRVVGLNIVKNGEYFNTYVITLEEYEKRKNLPKADTSSAKKPAAARPVPAAAKPTLPAAKGSDFDESDVPFS